MLTGVLYVTQRENDIEQNIINRNNKLEFNWDGEKLYSKFDTPIAIQILRIFLKNVGGPEKGRCSVGSGNETVYLAAFWVFLGRRTAWMFGKTPP